MSEYFNAGFFTSTSSTEDPATGLRVGNKAQSADFLALTLTKMFGNGISLSPSTGFQVVAGPSMAVTVKAGWGIMNGYPFHLSADIVISLSSSTSDQLLYIGVRLDEASGEYTNDSVYAMTSFVAGTDRAFARLNIPADAVEITDAMITDLRYNASYCGSVDEQRVSLAALAAEYQAALDTMNTNGIPNHHENHEYGGGDAISASLIGQYGVAALDVNGRIGTALDAIIKVDKTASWTLALADADHKGFRIQTGAVVVTIPPASSVAFTAGVVIPFFLESGTCQFVAGSGVTLNKTDSNDTMSSAPRVACLWYLGGDVWTVVGCDA